LVRVEIGDVKMCVIIVIIIIIIIIIFLL